MIKLFITSPPEFDTKINMIHKYYYTLHGSLDFTAKANAEEYMQSTNHTA